MNDKDWIRFFRVMNTLQSGRQVQKDDLDFFINSNEYADPAVMNSLGAKLGQGGTLSNEEYKTLVNEGRKLLTSPENKDKVLALAQKAEQGRISQNVRSGLNTMLAGTDIATSLGQIAKSKQLGRQTRRPATPSTLQRDPLLAQSLDSASRDTGDVQRALLPAREGIRDTYQADLGTARTASGGQAGAYGAYAQVASDRRNRANLDLVPMADQIRRQRQGRYDQLVGQHLQEGQAINASEGRYYPEALYQYNLDKQVAAGLGQVGRQNLRSSMTGFAQGIPDAAAQYATQQKYQDTYNRMVPHGGEDMAQIAVDAHKMTDNHWGGRPANFPMYRNYEDSYID